MGKKITLKVVGMCGWKDIKVRKNLIANNLKAIIAGVMLIKGKFTKITWEGKSTTGHKRLKDIGIVDGDRICIDGSDMNAEPASKLIDVRKDNEITMAEEELEWNSMDDDEDWMDQ